MNEWLYSRFVFCIMLLSASLWFPLLSATIHIFLIVHVASQFIYPPSSSKRSFKVVPYQFLHIWGRFAAQTRIITAYWVNRKIVAECWFWAKSSLIRILHLLLYILLSKFSCLCCLYVWIMSWKTFISSIGGVVKKSKWTVRDKCIDGLKLT